MRSVSLTDAEARLGELLDEIGPGEELVITRDGAPLARVSKVAPASEPQPIDWAFIDAAREATPYQETSAGEFVRWMRDTDRY
jgi:prevent-host-death family protein